VSIDLHRFLIHRIAFSPFSARIAFALLKNRTLLRSRPYRFFLQKHIAAVKKRNYLFPLVVIAENTNICNARCVMCPSTTTKRSRGFMDMALYRKIVDECARYPGVELRVTGFGEPLLDKNLIARIQFAKDKGIENVNLTTNASLLDEDMSRRILASGLDALMFSVDGYDKASYEKIRSRLDFDTVYGNIKRFKLMRGRRRKPTMTVSAILFHEIATHRKDIIDLWRPVADYIFIKPPEDWAGEMQSYKDQSRSDIPHSPCPYLSTQFVITWEGVAALCCRDFCNVRLPIGDVRQNTIYDIWHGKLLRKIREDDAVKRTLSPCRLCAYKSNWWGER
jgi:MoaA/NifB/PqqE/SkfB family radical SAM enzyme